MYYIRQEVTSSWLSLPKDNNLVPHNKGSYGYIIDCGAFGSLDQNVYPFFGIIRIIKNWQLEIQELKKFKSFFWVIMVQ